MSKIFKIFVVGFFAFIIFQTISQAKDLRALSDEFYSGLAGIIERNMNNPEQCVAEVQDYYNANQDKVMQIRQESEKALQQIAPQMDKYKSMTEEEAEAMSKSSVERAESRMSAAGKRYSDAMKAFMVKYPKEGMKIAGFSMALVPTIGMSTPEEMNMPETQGAQEMQDQEITE
jgi:ribosome-binding ATPase YchF (GTP1/OBG family)